MKVFLLILMMKRADKQVADLSLVCSIQELFYLEAAAADDDDEVVVVALTACLDIK